MSYKEKIQTLIDEIDNQLIERRSLIRLSILAIFSRHHIMLYGVPGVGKSYAISKIMEIVSNEEFFSILLSKATQLSELVPIGDDKSDEEILADRQCILSHKFIFLDEMFKANEELLNALLSILNERTYAVRGTSYDIPLSTVFCASNEIPSGEFIKPFKDRILFWFDVKPIAEKENKMRYLMEQFNSHKLTQGFIYDDILEVERKVKKESKKLQPEIAKCFSSLINNLRRGSIEVSDRKTGLSFILKAFKTSAILNDREDVDYSDLVLLKHMCWTDLRQKRQAATIVCNIIFGNSVEIKNTLLNVREKRNSAFIDYEEALNSIYDLEIELAHFEYQEALNKVKEFQKALLEINQQLFEINQTRQESNRRFDECLNNVFIKEEAEKLASPFKDEYIQEELMDLENSIDYAMVRCERVLEEMSNYIYYQTKFLEKENQ